MSRYVTGMILLCLAGCSSPAASGDAHPDPASAPDPIETVCGIAIGDIDAGPLHCADGSSLVATCDEGFIVACEEDGDFRCDEQTDDRNCLCGACT